MDKILEKLEASIDKWISDFETKPVATGVKLVIFYWIFKYIYHDIKETR